MIDGWQWDDSLFKGAAAYYERGRVPYAPGFAEKLIEVLGLDGSGRLLEVGCGPGGVARALAPNFAEVVGLDPDEGMLAEAERQAARQEVTNARWVPARAEDLPAGLGEFRAVLFAQSFHWTDRDRVAATVLTMLEPGGAFVLLADLKDETGEALVLPPIPPPLVAPPYDEIDTLVRRYLGSTRRAGQGTLPNGMPGRDEHFVLARAGFEPMEQYVVPAGQVLERAADDIVARTFSMSLSAPHLFGDRLADFERDLRALLRQAAPDGRFGERIHPSEIRISRKPRGGR